METPGNNFPLSGLDTTETYLYKLAHQWQIPHQFIIPSGIIKSHPTYINVIDIINKAFDHGLSLAAIERYLSKTSGRRWQVEVVALRLVRLVAELEGGQKAFLALDNLKTRAGLQVGAVLSEINVYRESVGKRAQVLAAFKTFYQDHVKRVAMLLEEDARAYRSLLSTQKSYQRTMDKQLFKTSDLAIVSEQLLYVVAGNYTADDTFFIFDGLMPSQKIPHIVCRNKETVFQKIYVPGPFEPEVRQKYLVNLNQVTSDGLIIFNVILKGTYTVIYHTGGGFMEVTVKTVDKDQLTTHVKRLFSTLQISEEVNQLDCQLRLYPTEDAKFDLKEYYLLHRIVVEPQLFQFYINETTSPYPLKTRPIYRYRPYWIIGSGIKDEATFTLSVLTTLTDSNYLTVSITAQRLESVYRLLTSLIPTLCLYYEQDIIGKSKYAALYAIPNLDRKTVSVKTNVKKLLRDQWPEVFTAAYLKSVNVKNLVQTTTDEAEADSWASSIIRHKDQQFNRMVYTFPPEGEGDAAAAAISGDNVLFYFTSISNEAPYIGFNANTYDDNPVYPLVPASFSAARSDQEGMGQGKGVASSLMALTLGRHGLVSESVEAIIGEDVKRLGVNRGPNAFIAAVLLAFEQYEVNDTWLKTYVQRLSPELREREKKRLEFSDKYEADNVLAVREYIRGLRPELFKQEMYDLTLDEIKEYLANDEAFFDPRLYVAGMQYIFDVDIFTIVPTTLLNTTTNVLEIPRYNLMHCHSGEVRKCVIIFKNPGIKSDQLPYPHCELIIPEDPTASLVFSKQVSQRVRQAMQDTLHFTTRTNNGVLYKQPYLNSQLYKVIGNLQVVSQYIDGKGKARAFTIVLKDAPVTLFTLPNAPDNYPHSEVVAPIDLDLFVEFCEGPVIRCSNLGAWAIHRASKEILYARVKDPKQLKQLQVPFSFDPLVIGQYHEEQLVTNIAETDKIILVINALFKWMFEVYSLDTATVNWVRFMKKYVTYEEPPASDLDYYYIAWVTERLPSVNDVNDCFELLSYVMPHNEKFLVLHSKAFYESITYVLQVHARSMHLDRTTKKERRIPGYYKSVFDFKPREQTKIFIGLVDAGANVIDPNTPYRIHETLNESDEALIEPLIYSYEQVLYIVQNTKLGDVLSAYQVCDTWQEEQVNIGYQTRPAEERTHDILIYNIVNGSLNPVFTTDDVTSDFYELLQFDSGKYAALLRL